MNEIKAIILNEVETNLAGCSMDNNAERTIVADRLASVLITQSLQQFADMLGGSIERDNEGQLVIYTDIREEDNVMGY